MDPLIYWHMRGYVLKYFHSKNGKINTEMHVMKKILMGLILLLCAVLLVACAGGGVSGGNEHGDTPTQGNSVKMTATVMSFPSADKIEVNVIEGEYGASGVYWVIVSPETALFGKDGASIALSDITEGATVEILYGGQVMMSYPPQIVAKSITLCK